MTGAARMGVGVRTVSEIADSCMVAQFVYRAVAASRNSVADVDDDALATYRVQEGLVTADKTAI